MNDQRRSMTGGKEDSKPNNRTPSGIVTRGSKPSSIPRPGTPGTPKMGDVQRDPRDTQRILDRLDSIEDALEAKIDDAIKSQEIATGNLGDRVTKIEKDSLVQAEHVGALKDDTCGVKVQLKVHGARITDLEDKIERLEREKRRNILVIEGLKEQNGEVTSVLVDKALSDLQVGFKSRDCTAIFRRGKVAVGDDKEGEAANGNRARGRPIIVILPSANEKADIFRHLKNLKDKEEWKGVYFNDDLTEQQANEQRDLRALAAFAKSKGFNSNVKAGGLWLDGQKYRYEELHRLPEEISLLKAKNLHILEDRAIVFQSPHSPLSNLFPCNVTYRGEAFLSAEAAYQFTRASECGYDREAQLIKQERNAYKVKSLTKDFKSTREWEEKAEQVMREILIAKFKSNRVCSSYLLATGERKLFEGTGDKRWGCGIPISKAHLISHKNPGRNLLGHLLEEVRRALKK